VRHPGARNRYPSDAWRPTDTCFERLGVALREAGHMDARATRNRVQQARLNGDSDTHMDE